MPKQLSEYTDKELIALGRKAVEQKLKDAEKTQVMARLYAEFKAKESK